jgi:hypothetical protein
MRVQALNRVVGEAVVNKEFRARLLADPRAALSGFDLAIDELELLATIRADSVDQFAQQLVTLLAPEPAGERGRLTWSRGAMLSAIAGGQVMGTAVHARLSPEP